MVKLLFHVSFNPRTYIRYDQEPTICYKTYFGFNPRTYIRYDQAGLATCFGNSGFNPRTYIRYDHSYIRYDLVAAEFQSTYLYKVRQSNFFAYRGYSKFQSTYLYKVRPYLIADPIKRAVSIHVPI